MEKKLIRLTESDLHRIVKESVNRILKESYPYGLDPYEWTEDEEEFNDWNRIDRGQQERDGKFAQDIHPQTDKRVFARQYALQPDLAQQMEKFREKDKKAYGF